MSPSENSDRETPAQAPVDISFFIPCYNEEMNVIGAIDTVIAACRNAGKTYEILVFDDASSDNTAAVVLAYKQAHLDLPITLVRKEKNQGVARNFTDGAFLGKGEFYRLVCGDNIEPLETHQALIDAVGTADMIVPYFVEIRNRSLNRKIISRLYTAMVNLASGYRIRYYNGCPIYRRADVMRYHVESTGFGYQAELLTRLVYEGRSYREVPLVSYDREGSTSINLKNLLSVGHSLFTIAMRRLRIVLFE